MNYVDQECSHYTNFQWFWADKPMSSLWWITSPVWKESPLETKENAIQDYNHEYTKTSLAQSSQCKEFIQSRKKKQKHLCKLSSQTLKMSLWTIFHILHIVTVKRKLHSSGKLVRWLPSSMMTFSCRRIPIVVGSCLIWLLAKTWKGHIFHGES